MDHHAGVGVSQRAGIFAGILLLNLTARAHQVVGLDGCGGHFAECIIFDYERLLVTVGAENVLAGRLECTEVNDGALLT